MAIDQTQKQKRLVSQGVNLAQQLDDLLNALQQWSAERASAGTFTDETVQAAEPHINAADLDSLTVRFGEAVALGASPVAEGATELRRDILRKARR